MITISLCMIVKNEEDTLPACLACVKGIADEIIIVDTGSTDNTKAVALDYGAKVYDFEWVDDFSAARNYAFQQATQEYLLWLDADDILLPADIEKFKELKRALPPDVDMVMMRYHMGVDERGEPSFTYYRERLMKREKNYIWMEPVHECVAVSGHVQESDIAIVHNKKNRKDPKDHGDRNIRIYEGILKSGAGLTPRSMYYYARELKDHGRYEDAAEWFQTFLRTGLGWVEDCITACDMMGFCYMRQNKLEEAMSAYCRAFFYGLPRAQTCCQIGYICKGRRKWKEAAYWFSAAMDAPEPDNKWGFREPEYAGYIPALELTVCCDVLGEREKAIEYNEMAAKCKPDSPAVLHNRQYFQQAAK